jgi:MAF protein
VGLLDLPWRAAPIDLDEERYLLPEPSVAAINVAKAKATSVQPELDEVVLAADTLVVIDGDILGKPPDPPAARAMLERLRGRPHHVFTGIAIRNSELEWAAVVDTRVWMRDYASEEVEAYIARGEPFDKAGGYAVQDTVFRPVERLEGCYLNVVGLPLCAVAAGLRTLGREGIAAAAAPPCGYCTRGESLVSSGY